MIFVRDKDFDAEEFYSIRNRNDRFFYVESNLTPYPYSKRISRINTTINVLCAVAALVVFKFNFLAFGACFIVSDIILSTLGYFFLIRRAKQPLDSLPLSRRKKELQEIIKVSERLQKQKDNFRDKSCRHCDYWSGWNSSCCYTKHKCGLQRYENSIRVLRGMIGDYEGSITKEERAMKEEENAKQEEKLKLDSTRSGDFVNKLEYITSVRNKLKLYKRNDELHMLGDVESSLGRLEKILNRRKKSISNVPSNMWIYLDELLDILESWEDLDSKAKSDYVDGIGKISEVLSENIDSVEERIRTAETQNIEVSIKVLLDELSKNGEDK